MKIRRALRHYPEFQETSAIEIWPKEVEMIPRGKFPKDPQRGRERVVKGAMDLFGVRKTVFES